MRISIGRGDAKHTFDVPTARDRVGREKMAEEIKNFLFRPALLNKKA